jgi:ribosomal protein L37AE/L43A
VSGSTSGPGSSSASGSDRASGSGRASTPYQCPFCGEEDLWPAEHEGRPVWHCRSCLRLFSVTFYGLASPEASAVPAHRPGSTSDWSDD